MAPLLRGRIASKGSGEDPKGALSLPRVCAEAAPAAMPVLCRRRAPAARSEAPVPFASRKKGPAFAGPYRAKGKRRGSGGRPPLPRYAQKQPLRQCRSCVDGARPPPGQKRLCPLQAAKRRRFCGTVSRQREVERVRRATSLSPGYAQKQPLRQCRSCHRRRAHAPCKRKNGPVFAGPFYVKGKRRGSGGRFPSPGCWTRPAPASRPGRRRSRPGGHPRRQSR